MRTKRFMQAVSQYARCERGALWDLLCQQHPRNPRCPVTAYLLGCQCWERGRVASAVRHFMVAHRVEGQLQSAALLVFAGLSWVRRRDELHLPVLLDTWEEFRRPEFDCFPKERALLDAFAEPEPGLKRVSRLAHQLWRLPILTLRAQLREALITCDAEAHPLLVLPA